jgi:hypothetical protein
MKNSYSKPAAAVMPRPASRSSSRPTSARGSIAAPSPSSCPRKNIPSGSNGSSRNVSGRIETGQSGNPVCQPVNLTLS